MTSDEAKLQFMAHAQRLGDILARLKDQLDRIQAWKHEHGLKPNDPIPEGQGFSLELITVPFPHYFFLVEDLAYAMQALNRVGAECNAMKMICEAAVRVENRPDADNLERLSMAVHHPEKLLERIQQRAEKPADA